METFNSIERIAVQLVVKERNILSPQNGTTNKPVHARALSYSVGSDHGLQSAWLLCPRNSPARILEGVASSYSMGSSCPRHQIHISRVSRIGSWIPYQWVTWETQHVSTKEHFGVRRIWVWILWTVLSMTLKRNYVTCH